MDPVTFNPSKTWSSIDIFLFSNGQNYSPPRKYHLSSEDIQWWDATLAHLGRTHYGSGHSSLDLYTIDGIKITGPLELINGAAYVAVEPPDVFIDTGYQEYLLRASRSWEKRAAQKSNNYETPNSDVITDENATQEDNLTGKTAEFDDGLMTSPIKAKTTKPHQLPPRKCITSAKKVQKKKSFDTHTTTIKKLSTEIDKVLPSPKKTLPNGVTNRKRSSLASYNRNMSQNKSSYQTNSPDFEEEQNKDKKERQSIVKASNIVDNLRHSLVPYNNKSNLNMEFQNMDPNKPDSDKGQPRVSIYNNKEGDPISIARNATSDQNVPNVDDDQLIIKQENNIIQETNIQDTPEIANQETSDKIKSTYNSDYKGNALLKDYNKLKEETLPILNIPNNIFNKKDSLSNDSIRFREKQITDEYIAYMNKGGVLLLKFNIKIKDCKAIFNKDKTNTLVRSTSLNNIPQSEKTSQVDIDVNFCGEISKEYDDQVDNHSIHSILNTVLTKCNDYKGDKNPRIIVIQCACQNYTEIGEDKKNDTNLCKCKCDTEGKSQKNKREMNEEVPRYDCYNDTRRISKVDPQKVLTDATNANIDNSPLYKTNGMHVKNLAQKFEPSDKMQSNNKVDYNSFNNDKSKNNGESQYLAQKTINNSEIIETNITENQDTISTLKSVCDKTTQTDWCNVLLEARYHEDNKYTFHLPSLYVLKQCKF